MFSGRMWATGCLPGHASLRFLVKLTYITSMTHVNTQKQLQFYVNIMSHFKKKNKKQPTLQVFSKELLTEIVSQPGFVKTAHLAIRDKPMFWSQPSAAQQVSSPPAFQGVDIDKSAAGPTEHSSFWVRKCLVARTSLVKWLQHLAPAPSGACPVKGACFQRWFPLDSPHGIAIASMRLP